MQFQRQLQDKLGEHEPNEVDELILDDLFENVENFTDDHKKTLELYDNLIHLSLNGFGLKSLKNFPKINTLEKLEIRNNKLTGSDLSEILNLYPTLYKLKIGQNLIKSVETFKCLAKLNNLKKLEVCDNEFTKNPNYRNDIFKVLPSLESIDNKDKKGGDVETTINDEDNEDFGEEDGEFDDEEFNDEDDEEDFEDEDDDEEEEPKQSKKPKKA